MTPDQDLHLMSILTEANQRIATKYVKGAEEHGPNCLADMPSLQLIDNAIDEATDQLVYLLTLRRSMTSQTQVPPPGQPGLKKEVAQENVILDGEKQEGDTCKGDSF